MWSRSSKITRPQKGVEGVVETSKLTPEVPTGLATGICSGSGRAVSWDSALACGIYVRAQGQDWATRRMSAGASALLVGVGTLCVGVM